ncbi:hypothetical protein ACS0TY_034239 [Phlomoides rotata]
MLNCELNISEENEPLISGGDGKSGTGSAVGSEHSDSDDDWEGVESTDLDEILVLLLHSLRQNWEKLKGILSFQLKQVLSEYPEAKMASELQVSSLGEAFQDLVKRLDDALQIFDEGPPFTLQRICEKLNKDWRGEDHATDVLSMSKHIPELKLPILMLGDIVISVETVARQAEERGHTLIDEIRILMVHGLLHLIGFNHELSHEAEKEMENEEEFLLKALGWKGKGLIHSAYDSESNGSPQNDHSDDRKRVGNLRFYKPKFGYIFCDIDGTLLNSKSQISLSTAQALKEASSRGVKVVIATGKTRPTVMNILNMVNLTGKDGIIYKLSPGVFVQGLLVYGR